ncbi:hypothetical protein CCP3SC5AM1_720007 [Gammaproteobacteria bacterium]
MADNSIHPAAHPAQYSTTKFCSGGHGLIFRYFRNGALCWGWRVQRANDPAYPSALHWGINGNKQLACETLRILMEKLPANWQVILRHPVRFSPEIFQFEIKIIFPPRTTARVAREGLHVAGITI